jgi:hypothetical protein
MEDPAFRPSLDHDTLLADASFYAAAGEVSAVEGVTERQINGIAAQLQTERSLR